MKDRKQRRLSTGQSVVLVPKDGDCSGFVAVPLDFVPLGYGYLKTALASVIECADARKIIEISDARVLVLTSGGRTIKVEVYDPSGGDAVGPDLLLRPGPALRPAD